MNDDAFVADLKSEPMQIQVMNDLKSRAQATAAVAANDVAFVDCNAKFPDKAISEARAQRLLGILVPRDLGGEGASISDVVDICYLLGRSCASTAMIYAMHQIMVACIVRHRQSNAWHNDFLRKICGQQLLLASSTTEGQGGGDLRASVCAVERDGHRISFMKSATVMSYGAHADGILTTARRSPDAEPSDQVLVALSKEHYQLEHLLGWDTLGMRGTCSAGFALNAQGTADQILPDRYPTIHSHTMVPVSHLAWSGVWAGIASDAVNRARKFIRHAGRRKDAQLPPGAAHLARANATLQVLRGCVSSALRLYELNADKDDELDSVDFQTAMNLLKVNASELAISTVMSSLQACGLSGYRNDTEFSVTRHLRDVLSSPIMINNDRILGNAALAVLLVDIPQQISNP
jgi:acyl-CoA dehydrogenase